MLCHGDCIYRSHLYDFLVYMSVLSLKISIQFLYTNFYARLTTNLFEILIIEQCKVVVQNVLVSYLLCHNVNPINTLN